MRLGFISQYFDPEPVSVFTLDFVKGLQNRGFDIDAVLTSFPCYPGGVVFPGWQQRWKHEEFIEGVRIVRSPQWPSHSPSIAKRVATYGSFAASATARSAVLKNSDAIYVYQPPSSAIAPVVTNPRLRKKPVILHVQDLWPDALLAVQSGEPASKLFDLSTRGLSRFAMASYKRADIILAITKSYRMSLIERGVPEGKIRTVYNWANERFFFPAERVGLSPFPVTADRKVVMFAGNAGPAQGLRNICLLVNKISTTSPISLVFVGRGTELDKLRSEFSGVDSNIHFLGSRPREEMNQLYAWADFSLVSLANNSLMNPTLPSKFQASLASGVPVIAIGGGELLALGGNPKAGIAAPVSDDDAVSAAFEKIGAMDASMLSSMRLAAREAYIENFSQEAGLDIVQDCFESLG
jgi:colanic acid biosynthesis glycosyl transferase WcaI